MAARQLLLQLSLLPNKVRTSDPSAKWEIHQFKDTRLGSLVFESARIRRKLSAARECSNLFLRGHGSFDTSGRSSSKQRRTNAPHRCQPIHKTNTVSHNKTSRGAHSRMTSNGGASVSHGARRRKRQQRPKEKGGREGPLPRKIFLSPKMQLPSQRRAVCKARG